MLTANYPPIDYVRQALRYEAGKLFWLERPKEHFSDNRTWRTWLGNFAGKEAGCDKQYKAKGDWRNKIAITYERYCRLYRRSILVYALHHDRWVIGLDHYNGVSLDDRIENLRPATQVQNMHNMRLLRTNTSGVKGVSWDKDRNKWMVQIDVNGKHLHVGRFQNLEDAKTARLKAAKFHHGEFFCDGTRSTG